MVNMQTIGAVAFLAGVLVAILSGGISKFVPGSAEWVTLLLVILGLVVGFLNVADKEIQAFLIAGVALLLVGIPNGGLLRNLDVILPSLGTALDAMLKSVTTLAAPAVLVISLKAFYSLARTVPATKGK